MRGHRHYFSAGFFARLPERFQKAFAVLIVLEDGLPVIAAGHHVTSGYWIRMGLAIAGETKVLAVRSSSAFCHPTMVFTAR